MSSSSGVSATKAQLYAPAGVALVLAIGSIIVGILLLLKSEDQGDASSIVKTIANTNGFKGIVKDSVLTLQSTNTGILKGPGLVLAESRDITAAQLSGFNNTNPGSSITAADSIKSGLEKILVFNASPLIGLLPSAGQIDETSTVFEAINRLSGSLFNLTNPFSVYTSVSTNSPTQVNLWGSVTGSTTFKQNLIKPGLQLELKIFGTVTSSGTAETATYILILDDVNTITISSPPTTTTGATRDIRLTITLLFDETNMLFNARCMLLNNPNGNVVTLQTVQNGQIVFDKTQQHTFKFAGLTSNSNMSTTISSSICSTNAGVR